MKPLFKKKKSRELLVLQLTAMIDIFALLVIFLIKGTVMSESDVTVPQNIKLPTSISKESIESAPNIVISKEGVLVSIWHESFELDLFRSAHADDPRTQTLRTRLKEYAGKLTEATRSKGVLLNVLADQTTSYRDVFDSIKLFRECGFDTLLFVTTADPKRGGG